MITLSLLLAAVALVSVLILRRRRDDRNPSDGDVLAYLRKNGSDLSKPHTVEFFLHFPMRTSALRAAESIEAAGFRTFVGPGPGTEYHVLCATREMIPVKAELAAIRARFDMLASSFGGTYEQWDAAVVPKNAPADEAEP